MDKSLVSVENEIGIREARANFGLGSDWNFKSVSCSKSTLELEFRVTRATVSFNQFSKFFIFVKVSFFCFNFFTAHGCQY